MPDPRHISLSLLLLALPAMEACRGRTVPPPGPDVSDNSSLAARIHEYVEPLARSGEFAGSVLVAQRGTVMFEHSYGEANVELNVPATSETRYRIHSVTKQFTAMAIMILAHRGTLHTDSSIRAYLPELPASWHAATVGHLLTHTAAIPQLEEQWFDALRRHGDSTQVENLIRIAPAIAKDTLVGVPGQAMRYNNFGYDLLACIVERVSGREFGAFLKESIFEPAGMASAGLDVRAESGGGAYVASAIVPRLASGYNGSPSRLQVAQPMMFGSVGAGGMHATARDLFAYDRALKDEALVPASVAARMLDGPSVRPGVAYGYGWMVDRSQPASPVIHHGGGNNGYIAEFARYPRQDAVIVILSNRGYADAHKMRRDIASMFLTTEAPAAR